MLRVANRTQKEEQSCCCRVADEKSRECAVNHRRNELVGLEERQVILRVQLDPGEKLAVECVRVHLRDRNVLSAVDRRDLELVLHADRAVARRCVVHQHLDHQRALANGLYAGKRQHERHLVEHDAHEILLFACEHVPDTNTGAQADIDEQERCAKAHKAMKYSAWSLTGMARMHATQTRNFGCFYGHGGGLDAEHGN